MKNQEAISKYEKPLSDLSSDVLKVYFKPEDRRVTLVHIHDYPNELFPSILFKLEQKLAKAKTDILTFKELKGKKHLSQEERRTYNLIKERYGIKRSPSDAPLLNIVDAETKIDSIKRLAKQPNGHLTIIFDPDSKLRRETLEGQGINAYDLPIDSMLRYFQ